MNDIDKLTQFLLSYLMPSPAIRPGFTETSPAYIRVGMRNDEPVVSVVSEDHATKHLHLDTFMRDFSGVMRGTFEQVAYGKQVEVDYMGPRFQAKTRFESIYERVTLEIAYQAHWCDARTGGFAGFRQAVGDEMLKQYIKPGEYAKSSDQAGRKILFIGTRYGAVILYEQFPNLNPSEPVYYHSDYPNEVADLGFVQHTHHVSVQGMGDYFGEFDDVNVGLAIERLARFQQ